MLLYPRCFRTTWCSWANCCWQVISFPAKDTDRIWWSCYAVLH